MSTQRHRYVAVRPVNAAAQPRLGPRHRAYHVPVRPHRTIFVFLRRLFTLVLVLLALSLVGLIAFKLWVDTQTDGLTYTYTDPKLPSNHVALVFGAGLKPDGSPSAMLYDRVATAADLYLGNKVDKLLMTGDNSTTNHNEVEAMRKTAVDLGVADEDIVLDYAGFSTWDSCYRAHEVFGVASATLVTQAFHLPRALYTCKELGVRPVGVVADRQPYPTSYNELREWPALANTFWSLLTNHQPKFLGPKVNMDEPQSR